MTDKDKDPWIGTTYDYANAIKQPSDICNDDKICVGNIKAGWTGIGVDLGATLSYIEVLLEGGNNGAMHGGFNGNDTSALPLGNRYFLSTGANCSDSKGNSVKRSLYIDNVPNGDDPTLKEMGIGDESLNGLIPGLLGDAMKMNPAAIFGAFMQGSSPQCTNIHMKTIDVNNMDGTGSGFVLDSEIKSINPCAFVSGVNPLTNEKCATKESFINANNKMQRLKKEIKLISLKRKPIANLYTAAVGGLLVYLVYRIITKK